MRQIDVGGQSFRSIREEGMCYVDKSMLISDILSSNKKGVFLFTRPRRFGKSLNLSMLDAFFNLEYKNNTWFDGLEISDHHEFDSYRNAFPVIRLDMKDTSVSDFDSFLRSMGSALLDAFKPYYDLMESECLSMDERALFESIFTRTADAELLKGSIKVLSEVLAKDGPKPIVLIDEYDSPINRAFGKDMYEGITEFMGGLYSSTLKGNKNLQFAVVTGVMQIAKESIFSGVNNLKVNNVFSVMSDERFGFTPEEVLDLCTEYGHPERFEEAKEWYDGYRFGDAEIYNPWSLLNYIQDGFRPAPYWAGTSGNEIIGTLMDHADAKVIRDLDDLANGVAVRAVLYPIVAMGELPLNRSSIYSVMVVSGYLKAVPSGGGYELSVPNVEMRSVFASMMLRRIHSDAELAFMDLFSGLENGDVKAVEKAFDSILDENIPFILLTKESDYELIIGAAAMACLGRYTVSLEKESGNGRADIVMRSNRPDRPDIVLELKRTRSAKREVLVKRSAEALAQIRERRYFRSMKGRILLWGLCFYGKDSAASFEEIVVERPGVHSVCRSTGASPLYGGRDTLSDVCRFRESGKGDRLRHQERC